MKILFQNRHKKLRPQLSELRSFLIHREKLLPIRINELSVVFLNDLEMSHLHQTLMNDPTPTDILTLDYGKGMAELFISLDTALRQSRENKNSFQNEVRLYLVHGLLHLSGYDDQTPAQRKKMRQAEKKLLNNEKV